MAPSHSGGETTEVVVRRRLPAPREVVYALWLDAERMPSWILDGGTATIDPRVGGKYHLEMHDGGKHYPHHGEYLELVPPERIVFTWISEGTDWQPSVVTIELTAVGDETDLVLTHRGLPPAQAESHFGGWTEIAGWLDEELRGVAGKVPRT